MTTFTRAMTLLGLSWLITSGADCRAGDPAAQPGAVTDSAVEITSLQGWSGGVSYFREKRELQIGDGMESLDGWHAGPYVGFKPVKWVGLEAGLGVSQADVGGRHGELGLDWGVGAKASFFEYVLQQSPVFGKQQSIRLGGIASYRHSESNDSEADFTWHETMFAPIFSYAVNLRGPDNWHPYEPSAVTVRGGPVFSTIDGKHGARDVSENRDFGVTCGVDFQLSDGLVAGLDVLSFGSDETSLIVTFGYNF